MNDRLSIRPAIPADAAEVVAIYNQGIEERTATFETAPRKAEDLLPRITDPKYPLLVAVDASHTVVAWAGIGQYRPRECYAGIGEFSIYVARTSRGKKIGVRLLSALIEAAAERGFWKLVSRIFVFNSASRSLCAQCGFREVGVYEKHGKLEGRWTDVVIVERLIAENLR